MARKVTWGTPHPTSHYVMPRSARTLVVPATLVGFALGGALLAAHFAGFRAPLAPGPVTSAHAPVEAACENCHSSRGGVAPERCQRCHDAGAAPRLTHAAHVLFGSGDPARAAAAPAHDCATCHVDHAGRRARLDVDEVQCTGCHFRGFGAHPEFAVRRSPVREVPGLKFPHERHLAELAKQGAQGVEACVRCHEPDARRRDLEPLSFDRHCAACHAKGGSLGAIEPLPAEHALPLAQISAQGVRGEWLQRVEEFAESRGRVQKDVVRHADPWVLWNLDRLQSGTEPEAWAERRSLRQARLAAVRRRLSLQAPPAGLDAAGLTLRRESLARELAGLEARIAAQKLARVESAGASRIEDVANAVAAADGDAAAEELRGASSNAGAVASVAQDAAPHAARVSEILALLDATEAADPTAAGRADDLRRRARALVPGASGVETLTRARDQRLAELQRLDDELRLREAGLPPTPVALLAADRRAATAELAALDAERRLAAGRAAFAAEEQDALTESVLVLAAPCLKCHVLERGALADVRAARPVLTRSVFVHQPHLLQAECTRCHEGVAASRSAADLHVPALSSCQECHRGGRVTQACAACHRYHPQATP